MLNPDNASTPIRLHRDMLPSSPEPRFSSPSLYSMNTWTPIRSTLWSSFRDDADSSPSYRTASFATPGGLDFTPNAFESSGQKGDSCKRGRPRADQINQLIHHGSSSPNGIKCKVCNRVFPREKSLQAHLRTHTGERPYVCDYPNCTKTFTQSGQLKTHQRLHAGEKPFICSAPGCTNRYTHANRTCPLHPHHKVHRSNDLVLQPTIGAGENPTEVAKWLENYRRDRIERTPAKVEAVDGPTAFASPTSTPAVETSSMPCVSIPSLPLNLLSASHFNVESDANSDMEPPSKRLKTKRGLASQLEQENRYDDVTSQVSTTFLSFSPAKNLSIHKRQVPTSPPPLTRSPLKTFNSNVQRSILGNVTPRKIDTDVPMSPNRRLTFSCRQTPPSSPVKTLSLKKRWLKEVVKDQSRVQLDKNDEDVENLASPIRWNDAESTMRRSPLAWTVASALVEMAERDFSSTSNQPLNLSISSRR